MTVEAADVMRIQMQITYHKFFHAVALLQLGEDVYGEGFKTELHRLSVNTGKNTWYYIKGRFPCWVGQLILQSPCWEDALLMQLEAQLPKLHFSFIFIWFGTARANEVSDRSSDFKKCNLLKHASMAPLYHPQLWVARLSTAHLLAAYYAQQKFSNVTWKTYQLFNQFIKFQNPPNFKSDWLIRSFYLNLMKA